MQAQGVGGAKHTMTTRVPRGTGGIKASVRPHESLITRRDGSTALVREGMDLALHQMKLEPLLAAPLSPRRRGK